MNTIEWEPPSLHNLQIFLVVTKTEATVSENSGTFVGTPSESTMIL